MAILNCECGHTIWSELWWKEPGHVLLFFDDVETSETYGERVIHCPGCGQRLRSGALKPQSDEHSYGGTQRRHEAVW